MKPGASVIETAAAIARGDLTATDLAEARLAAIRARPSLMPFTVLEPATALAQAEAVDKARRRGQPLGPLAGVALAHKDMFDRAGHATGFGAHPSARRVATATAPVLARLDAAGQVDLGRLAMSEFALGPTGHNHHIGMPDNPAVPGAITGGSSSGSGAAVAAGLVPAALGSDTGGSIRLPAACCGVVGFKPSQGLVPLAGAMPLSPTQDCIGPLARSVADARLILSLIATPGLAPRLAQPAAPLARGTRVGFSDDGFLGALAPAMVAALREARAALADLGAQTAELDLRFLDDLAEPANVIAVSEAAAIHADRLRARPETYGPQVRARLAQAQAIPAPAYLRARQIRTLAQDRMAAEIWSRVDLLVLPSLPGAPPLSAEMNVGDGPRLTEVIAGMTRLTRPASILGLPAISLPVAISPAGPISLQLIGPAFADAAVADLAAALEGVFTRALAPA